MNWNPLKKDKKLEIIAETTYKGLFVVLDNDGKIYEPITTQSLLNPRKYCENRFYREISDMDWTRLNWKFYSKKEKWL